MTIKEELKAEIRAAFGSVPFPSHQGLRGSMAMDCHATDAQVRSITTSQDIHGEWWQIPHDELRVGMLGLCYLDAAGVLFYLPAYLTMALEDVGKKRLSALDLLEVGIGDDESEASVNCDTSCASTWAGDLPATLRAHMEGRLSRLNDPQRKVCVRVLQFLRLQLIDDRLGEHRHERDRIQRILDDAYWRDLDASSLGTTGARDGV